MVSVTEARNRVAVSRLHVGYDVIILSSSLDPRWAAGVKRNESSASLPRERLLGGVIETLLNM